jgi:hypothetical protein
MWSSTTRYIKGGLGIGRLNRVLVGLRDGPAPAAGFGFGAAQGKALTSPPTAQGLLAAEAAELCLATYVSP